MAVRPEDLWPVDERYRELYETFVNTGRESAQALDAVIVSIARNSMPVLENTAELVRELMTGFNSCRWFVYENDSEDGTAEYLDSLPFVTVQHDTLGGLDSRGFEKERTERLAGCRTRCQDWVRKHAADTQWTIVLDTDPPGGFSVDGVFNSIGWLSWKSMDSCPRRPGGMASYSLWKSGGAVAGYDSWAARPTCWWEDRRDEIGFAWFHSFLPPVGSYPLAMNSAFGGLCVYKTEAFLSPQARYRGDDCEHVGLHRGMAQDGYQMWMNPGCRYIAYWTDDDPSEEAVAA